METSQPPEFFHREPMADVTVKRCTLRIVRHGGWGWGNSRDRLVAAASRALPILIGRQLAAMFPEVAEVMIDESVRIALPASLTQLGALAADAAQPDPHDLASRTLEARVALSFVEALVPTLETLAVTRREREDAATTTDEHSRLPSPAAHALLRLLRAWLAEGELPSLLATFSLETLAAFHGALLDEPPPSTEPVNSVVTETAEKLVREAVKRLGALSDLSARLRARLAAIAEAAAQLSLAPSSPSLRMALNSLLPVEDELVAAFTAVPVSAVLGARATADERTAYARERMQRRRVAAADAADQARYAPSTLPFLLMVPLSRIGYLQTVGAAFAAARCGQSLPLFAAGFAHKVLAPPARGWQRAPAAIASAKVFAGVDDALPEPSMVELSSAIRPHLPLLDAVLARNLIRGHTPGQPLLLHRTGDDGLLLVESEGGSPIAWAPSVEGLTRLIADCAARVLIAAESARPELLAALDRAGVRFVTDAPPSRHERWRALRHRPDERFWTNDRSTALSELLVLGRRIRDVDDDSALLWRALFVERRAVPLAPEAEFERSLTLAAAVALGAIAWTLWGAHEPVTPLLTLERFASLDGEVRRDERALRVRLPLGRRHRDLLEHGLLGDVADVPWNEGRVLSFSGG
jgi:hypothetical protein